MPGMETRAPERTETSRGLCWIAEAAADGLLDTGQGLLDLGCEVFRVVPVVLVEGSADFGGDGEAGGNGQADRGHLGEVGALAAEQVAHFGAAFVVAGSEGVDPFRLSAFRSAFDFGEVGDAVHGGTDAGEQVANGCAGGPVRGH